MPAAGYVLNWCGFVLMAGSFVAAAALAQDAPSGTDPQVAFNTHCRTCHSAQPGDNRLGPSLHGVMGRKAGAVEGFAYSPGFKTTDLVWDAANMDKFITSPTAFFRAAIWRRLPVCPTRPSGRPSSII